MDILILLVDPDIITCVPVLIYLQTKSGHFFLVKTYLPRKRLMLTIHSLVKAETFYHRDNPLLYIAYVMLIWAAPIPADRWHCSL